MRITCMIFGALLSALFALFTVAGLASHSDLDNILGLIIGLAAALTVMGTVMRYRDEERLSAMLFAAAAAVLYFGVPEVGGLWALFALFMALLSLFAPSKDAAGFIRMDLRLNARSGAFHSWTDDHGKSPVPQVVYAKRSYRP